MITDYTVIQLNDHNIIDTKAKVNSLLKLVYHQLLIPKPMF